jgi:DNA-binding CsgD family transcriptional regulator
VSVAVLSERQQQVLRLVAEGLNDRQVGARLGIAEGTARNHLYRAGLILGSHHRAHAVHLARQQGLLDPAGVAA